MGQLLLMSVVFAVIAAALLVPLNGKLSKKEISTKAKWISLISVFAVMLIAGFCTLYFIKIDMQWSIVIYVLPFIALFGAIIATGIEQKIKSFIVFVIKLQIEFSLVSK